MTCSNIEIEKRTKRDDIQMFVMARRPNEKNDNFMNIVLEPFVKEMMQLEEKGLDFERKDGSKVNIKVGISKVICDNLAQNEILGFKMTFGAGSSCRLCLEKRERFKLNNLGHSLFDYSFLTYDQERPNKKSLGNDFGIVRPCILTKLQGVNIGNIMSPDIFHDLYGEFVWIDRAIYDLFF